MQWARALAEVDVILSQVTPCENGRARSYQRWLPALSTTTWENFLWRVDDTQLLSTSSYANAFPAHLKFIAPFPPAQNLCPDQLIDLCRMRAPSSVRFTPTHGVRYREEGKNYARFHFGGGNAFHNVRALAVDRSAGDSMTPLSSISQPLGCRCRIFSQWIHEYGGIRKTISIVHFGNSYFNFFTYSFFARSSSRSSCRFLFDSSGYGIQENTDVTGRYRPMVCGLFTFVIPFR